MNVPPKASALSYSQVTNAQANLSVIDSALNDIRRLLLERQTLQDQVDGLKKEKARLSRQVQTLRVQRSTAANPSPIPVSPTGVVRNTDHIPSGGGGEDKPVRKSNSAPDLTSIDWDDDSDDDDEDEDGHHHHHHHDHAADSNITPCDGCKAPVPHHFYCPLTLEIMKHPMQQKGTNKNYERGAILEWIYFGTATCPLTRQKLHPSDFEENLELKKEIEKWRSDHGVNDDDDNDDDESMDNSVILERKLNHPTPEAEARHQQHRCFSQVNRHGSLTNLVSLRNRILANRDDRVRRHHNGSHAK